MSDDLLLPEAVQRAAIRTARILFPEMNDDLVAEFAGLLVDLAREIQANTLARIERQKRDGREPCRECGGERQLWLAGRGGPTSCPRCSDGWEPDDEELEGHPEPGHYDYARLDREERGEAKERAMNEEREPR